MNTITVVLIILILFITLLLIIVKNQLKKVKKYESILQEQVMYIKKLSLTLTEGKQYLENLDERGVFRSDDEVGYFFDQMLEVQKNLDNFIIPPNYGEKE